MNKYKLILIRFLNSRVSVGTLGRILGGLVLVFFLYNLGWAYSFGALRNPCKRDYDRDLLFALMYLMEGIVLRLSGISFEAYWDYFPVFLSYLDRCEYFLLALSFGMLVDVITRSIIRILKSFIRILKSFMCIDGASIQPIHFICCQVIDNWEGFLRLFITYGFSLNTGSSILPLICLWPLLSCFLFLIVGFKDSDSDLVFKRITFITSCLSLSSVSLLSFAFDEQSTGFQFLYSIVDLLVLNLNIALGLDGLGLVFLSPPFYFIGLF